jgi:hypothetical protein
MRRMSQPTVSRAPRRRKADLAESAATAKPSIKSLLARLRAAEEGTQGRPERGLPQRFPLRKAGRIADRTFAKDGLAEPVLRAATFDPRNWVARYGVVFERALAIITEFSTRRW